MEHKPVHQLRAVADVAEIAPPIVSTRIMTRAERLAHWADLLEREPKRMLATLGDIEFQPYDTRPLLRADESALSVAFADPVLREQGLKGDRLGDVMEFFSLTEGDSHRLFCSCMYGRKMSAATAASAIRSVSTRRGRILALGVATVMAMTALPVLGYVFG